MAQLALGNYPAFSVERCRCVIDAVAFLFIAMVVYVEIDEAILILGHPEKNLGVNLYGLRRSGYIFGTLGILFNVIGLFTLCTMKVHFPRFFKKHQCAMIAAIIGLSLPITFRGVLDYLRGSNSDYYLSLASNGMYWEVVSYGVGSFIPSVCQLSSLIFGFIRSKMYNTTTKGGVRSSAASLDSEYSRTSSFSGYQCNFFDPPMPVTTFAKNIVASKKDFQNLLNPQGQQP